ncbi:Signal transduction histidine kinase [Candidatus Rhodobacter oscarellae]|uniref:Signal transduction histidine kinase n=1 Tax=Candidatus Rhodobacter oscarellae TaxID=1675527 RepID=A0A0J9E4E9_9RHOB|nr:histidine phosphotransferase family protein [Candidatus Rhodobacter lobularis]KMW56724.1 Signal transduction histidine kinase [Candidatus Rhodobacter lobularis]
MTSPTNNIAALLGSRICHDLVSPIGAISNGVELLQMSGDASGPEIELIHESVENANARIRFFRIAFGVASPQQVVGANEVRDILTSLTRNTRMEMDWQSAADHTRADVKLIFLLLQCFEAAMPWGGHITITHSGGTWQVSGTSDRMKIRAELWDALQNKNQNAEISASEVQFLLLPELLAMAGRSLQLEVSETGITARF